MTFLAALRCDEITAPFVLDGPINSESFLAYVAQVLAPALKHGDIVVMDNSPLASTGARRSTKVSAPKARGGSSCRNIRQTSIRSIFRRAQEVFAKQNCCEKPRSAPKTASGGASAHCSNASPQPNAQTTSEIQATLQPKTARL
jgi:transposase